MRNHICLNLLKELEHGIKCTPQKAHADTFFDVTLMNAKKAKQIYYIAQNTSISRLTNIILI